MLPIKLFTTFRRYKHGAAAVLLAALAPCAAALPLLAQAQSGENSIESLDAPKPAEPPRPENAGDRDLDEKRAERARRDDLTRPYQPSPGEIRRRGLLKEALKSRQRKLFMHMDVAFGVARGFQTKSDYTFNPTTHFSTVFRPAGAAADGRASILYGLRIAPFSGSGKFEHKPGRYGLTEFGPMIGIGKFDPATKDDGNLRQARRGALDDVAIPVATGASLVGGIALETRSGEPGTSNSKDIDNDFNSKGVMFDAPGLWIEGRHIRLLYGGIGYEFMLGWQLGQQREFFYGGLGVVGVY